MTTFEVTVSGCIVCCGKCRRAPIELGALVWLFLDTATFPTLPEYIPGTIVGITPTTMPATAQNPNGVGNKYLISYDETLIAPVLTRLKQCDLKIAPVCPDVADRMAVAFTGTFKDFDGKVVTVENGLIVSVE